MNSKLSQWCNGFMEMGWIAAVIAIPLFFNIHSDRVFEPDKLTLLRSIALLMSVTWLVKFINEKEWEHLDWLGWNSDTSIWRQPFILPIFLLVVIYLLSTLFSITPYVSWAGSYQRLQGTYTTLSYIVVFTLMAATMRSRPQVNRVITAIIITSIPISFYGMLQHFDLDPLPWGGNTVTRIAGHMGNAIFVAAYLIMAVPPTLARIIDAFTNILGDEDLSYADVIRASIYIFALAIQLLAIYWSSSRGPWIGLGVGLFAFVLILLVSLRNADTSQKRLQASDLAKVLVFLVGGVVLTFVFFDFVLTTLATGGHLQSLGGPMSSFVASAASLGVVTLAIFIMVAMRRGWRWLWLSWLMLALLVALWLGAFNFADTLDEQFGETPILGNVTTTLVEWNSLPSIGRLGRLLESDRSTGKVRVLIWEGVLKLISIHDPLVYPDGHKDPFNFLRPLIGYGPESMYVAYNRFYPPELATVEARNASPDRSHNETFDALAITGGLGFLIWQVLYLSVFYFGFKWLGVIRSQRDRNLLVALWILGAITATAVIIPIKGVPFFGVAVPFGSIMGLVLYLIYYALFAYANSEDIGDPFATDRLLMTALVTAVLAHYVEIHFGIAIAATRLHFFVYVSLMFIVGYLLPKLKETPVVIETKSRKRRRVPVQHTPELVTKDAWGPVLLHGLMLLLMIGIMGYEFTTYSRPPDKVIQISADITVGEIFHQSLFVNSRKEFADSPFIFLTVMLTWTLGVLVSVSEMTKNGELEFPTVAATLRSNRQQLTTRLFGFSVLASVGGVIYMYTRANPITITGTLGRTLLLIWVILSMIAATALSMNWQNNRFLAASTALTGILFTLPVFISGGILAAFLVLILSLTIFYLLWDGSWRRNLLPIGVMAFISLAGGFSYAYLQAFMVKRSIAPQIRQPFTSIQALHVFEVSLATHFLTLFYIFVITLLFVAAFILARHYGSRTRDLGTKPALVALLVLFSLAFVGVSQTNVRVIQADVVFKRGKPFDDQAARLSRSQDTLADAITSWDNTIAIYEHALELAPREDFYYLFLGRAYLERSTIETDSVAQANLFSAAEERLLLAQEINPLNTDHTANLARLNTRLTQLAQDDATREKRLERAETFYKRALELSPQNSIIRNEYAGLTLDLRKDCDKALGIYDESVKIDPYFATLYFARADAYITCAGRTAAESQEDYYRHAIESLNGGLEYEPKNERAWLQLGQLYQQVADYEDAIPALQNALDNDTTNRLPTWNLNYLIATAYRQLGDDDAAIEKAQLALSQAPTEAVAEVQQFLEELGVTDIEAPSASDTGAVALSGERPFANIEPAARNGILSSPPPFVLDTSLTYDAIISTEKGDIRLRLFDDQSPITVNNFVFLAEQGFYDGTTFHRVLADFMAQGGDPTGLGSGGPGYQFEDEVDNGLKFDRPGLLAMANAGSNTNGSQFFITFVPTPWLDGQHTIFGELISGEDVLNSLTLRDPTINPGFPGDLIQRIEIVTVNE